MSMILLSNDRRMRDRPFWHFFSERHLTETKKVNKKSKQTTEIFWHGHDAITTWNLEIFLHFSAMAEKLNEFASKLGKNGGPKGLGIGIKLLAVAAAGAWGVKESMYTGNS